MRCLIFDMCICIDGFMALGHSLMELVWRKELKTEDEERS
jgi:hypothetical protein